MKIWLIYQVVMEFWINIHGCHPYPLYVLNQLKNYSYILLATALTLFAENRKRHYLKAWNCNKIIQCTQCGQNIFAVAFSIFMHLLCFTSILVIYYVNCSELTPVHFKNTVARSSVLSKLWSFSIIHQLKSKQSQLMYYWKWS